MNNDFRPYIQLSPDVLQLFKESPLPIKSIEEITGRKTTTVAIFSDYGPNNAEYDTFGYYITDWGLIGSLASQLRKVKNNYGIENRTIDFKGRKDELKRMAFPEWVSIIRQHPGLIYSIAWDKRVYQTKSYQQDMNALKKQLQELGFESKAETYLRMITAISFVVLLAPILQEYHKLAWITDPDEIFDTDERKQQLCTSLGYLLDDALDGKKLSQTGVMTKFAGDDSAGMNQSFEELLSIADIAASIVGSGLTNKTESEIESIPKDEAATEIAQELADFPQLYNDIQTTDYRHKCKIGLARIEYRQTEAGEITMCLGESILSRKKPAL